MESHAKMDNKISAAQYSISQASNIAQLALSYYYDGGMESKELEDIFIICSVLAQVAIDGCKREYDINVNKEVRRLSRLPCMKLEDGKKYPVFYAEIQKLKENKNMKDSQVRKFQCPMEILADLIEEQVIDLRKQKQFITYTCKLNTVFQYETSRIRDSKQYKKVISIVQKYDREVKALDKTKDSYSDDRYNLFDNCIKALKNLTINKSTMSSLINYAFACNGDIRNRLLTVLYDKDFEKFLTCFKKSEKSPVKNLKTLENKGA